MPHTAVPSAANYRRQRAGGDLYGRSLIGPLFYAIGAVVTGAISGWLRPLQILGWLPAAVFLVFFVLRRKNRLPLDFADTESYVAWRRRHWGLIHAGCLLWGALFVRVALISRDYPPQLTIVVLCSVMYGAALSQAFAMERQQTTLTLALLYGPALATCVTLPSLRPIALILAVYSLYLLSSMRRLAREYDAQMETEYALILSRAEVEKLIRIDALTGLANRREYENVFPRAWHQAGRQGVDLALIVFDLDHFKGLNDRHGHLAGDACLQHFAQLLRSHFRRESDVLARIGGEEFVVILPGSSASDAARMAETFRETLAASPCGWHGDPLPFTVSVGVGTADWAIDAQPDATFARVDLACYEAKTRGRNRVVVARGGEEEARRSLRSVRPS